MTDIAKYLVRSPKQVVAHLKMLIAERCLVSAAFGDEDKDTFLTAILDIDEKKQTITIDCGPKEYLNRRLVGSALIKCRTKCKGIKVLFEGRKVKKAGGPGQPAFSVPIPSSIYWEQRRQFYRVKSPLSKKSYCTLIYRNEAGEESTIDLNLHDISASGIAILNESTEFATQLLPDAVFMGCRLVLEDENNLTVDLEVRHTLLHNPNHHVKVELIGCDITNSTPKIESTILRYMQNVEREIKQKEK